MAQNKFLTYKGKPIVRKGNEIYYGNMYESHVVMLKILSTKTVGDMEVAEKVSIQLLATDDTLPATERVVKKSEKIGLYSAMDIAEAWLKRELLKNKQKG